jgi:hypothetical protein
MTCSKNTPSSNAPKTSPSNPDSRATSNFLFVVPGFSTALRLSLLVFSSFVFRISADGLRARTKSKLGSPRAGFARGSCFVIAQFSRPAHPLLHSVKLLQFTGSIVGKVRRLPAQTSGKERSAESGVKHFAFCEYSSSPGRWMSPDPAGIFVADVTNPRVARGHKN